MPATTSPTSNPRERQLIGAIPASGAQHPAEQHVGECTGHGPAEARHDRREHEHEQREEEHSRRPAFDEINEIE